MFDKLCCHKHIDENAFGRVQLIKNIYLMFARSLCRGLSG